MGPFRAYGALNPLNAELNPICHLLALLGAHHIFRVSRIRANSLVTNEAKLGHPQNNSNVTTPPLIDCTQSSPCTGLDRPLGPRQVEALRLSRQSVHEGGKVVSPTHRPPLPPWYSHPLEAELTPGLKLRPED
jgi:hypothetical protein